MRLSLSVILALAIVEESQSAALFYKRRRLEFASSTTALPTMEVTMQETTTREPIEEITSTTAPTTALNPNRQYLTAYTELLNNLDMTNKEFTDFMRAMHPTSLVPTHAELDKYRTRVNLRSSVPYWFFKALKEYIERGALDVAELAGQTARLSEQVGPALLDQAEAYELASHWIMTCVIPMKLRWKSLIKNSPCVRLGNKIVVSTPFKYEIKKSFLDELDPKSVIDLYARPSDVELMASSALASLHEPFAAATAQALAHVKDQSEGTKALVHKTVVTVRSLVSIPLTQLLAVVDVIGTDGMVPVPEDTPEEGRRDWKFKMKVWKIFHGNGLLKFLEDPVSNPRPLRLDLQTGQVTMRPLYARELVRIVGEALQRVSGAKSTQA